MKLVIVPNELRDAIDQKIDAAVKVLPEPERDVVERDRHVFHQQLLDWYDEHGSLPDFSLELKAST